MSADASVFRALADSTRRSILDRLLAGEKTVSELISGVLRRSTRMTQSAFSQHLAVLWRAGLVSVRRDGRERRYSVRAQPLLEVAEWVMRYDRFWTRKLKTLGQYLEGKQRARS